MSRRVIRTEGFVLEDPITRPGSTTAFTITFVEKEQQASESRVLECYAEYEDLPDGHPLQERYRTQLAAWLHRGDAKPPHPLRLHWHMVAEEGVRSERVRQAWLLGEDALMRGGEGAVTQLLRNYLRRKYGDHD